MESLYDKHRQEFDRLASDGYSNIREAAKWFETPRQMDIAIGFNGAAIHWTKGERASTTSDRRCQMWLDSQRTRRVASTALDLSTTETEPAKSAGSLLFVACPAGTEEKARKLLAFIGCEITDV